MIFRAARFAAANEYAQWGGTGNAERENKFLEELTWLAADAMATGALIRELFPDGVPLDAAFYARLTQFKYALGISHSAGEIVTVTWVAALRDLGSTDREKLLLAVTSPEHDFFVFHHSLRRIVAVIPLDPAFAARWFPALLARLGDDMVRGGVGGAMEGYCEDDPSRALSVLEAFPSTVDPGPQVHELIRTMLGTLRTVALQEPERRRLHAVEKSLEGSPDPSRKEVFASSWIITAFRSGLSKEALVSLSGRFVTAREKDHWFAVLCRVIMAPKLDPGCLHAAVAWLREHASPNLSPNAKYRLVESAGFVCGEARFLNDASLDLWEPILAMLPIATEHTGTWNLLELLLVSTMHRDRAAFERRLTQLCQRSAKTMVPLIRSGEGFPSLVSGMTALDGSDLITSLVFSSSVLARQVGLYFFDKLHVQEFSKERLEAIDQRDLVLTLCAYRLAPLYGEVVSRFLLAILPRILKADAGTQKEYASELLIQCKNYSDAGLQTLKRAKVDSPLVARVIEAAEEYYARLQETRDSPLTAMRVPSLEFVARSKGRALDRQIREGAESGSIMTLMVKKVDMLYGRQFSSFEHGALSDPTGTKEHGFQFEIPRLEEIDPEGIALRRWRSMEIVSNLQEQTFPAA